MKEAMDVYLLSNPPENDNVEKSLALTNEALELDDHNLSAWDHKVRILFYKRDLKGLLKVSDDLIELMPNRPYYLGQKALYLELNGDTAQAKEFYDKSISMYQQYIKTDSLDFNLMMEYVTFLEASGDTTLSGRTLKKMQRMNYDDYQKQVIQAVKQQRVQKERMKSYLSGEISYDQIATDENVRD